MKLYRVSWIHPDGTYSPVHVTDENSKITRCGILIRDRVLCKKVDLIGTKTRYKRCPGCGSVRIPWHQNSCINIRRQDGLFTAYGFRADGYGTVSASRAKPQDARQDVLRHLGDAKLAPHF
jgi:hypothetical protein